MREAGVEPARIAERLKIPLDDIQKAIDGFNAVRASVSSSIVETVFNAEAIRAINGAGDRLQAAMDSHRFTGAYSKAGDPIFEPDHTMAIESIKTAKDIAEIGMPKGGGAAINIGINNAGRDNGGSGGPGRSFEAMVRLAEHKRKLELGDGSVATLDADIVENASADDDDVELDDPDDAGIDED